MAQAQRFDLSHILLIIAIAMLLAFGYEMLIEDHTPRTNVIPATVAIATPTPIESPATNTHAGQWGCTAVSDECGDMTPGPRADYGTGYHVSADGRVRPNPPAGWKWAGK